MTKPWEAFMITTYRRWGGLVAVAVTAASGLAGCGGSSAAHVASLGSSSGHSDASTTTLPRGSPTQLLNEWTTCERSHGDPNQIDPTIDANKVIHIAFPATVDPGATGIGPHDPCGAYLTAASTVLAGGTRPQPPDPVKLEKFAQCMRAHGVPDFPDPSPNGLQLHGGPGSDLNPSNPTFKHASQLCSKKEGIPIYGVGTPQPGTIEATHAGPPGGPGGNGGAGASTKS